MLSKGVYTILLLASLLGARNAFAQSGFFIPKQSTIYFSGDSATIFSDMINQGVLGIQKNAVVNFSGKSWENDAQSRIYDESLSGDGSSGMVRFIAGTYRQQLNGGYNAATRSGPAFTRLQIRNPYGIELTGTTAKVKEEVVLTEGLVYLQDYIFIVGNNNPGKISSYTASRFFVTGNKPGAGLLLRENITSLDDTVPFPVGTRLGAYTPAAIRSHTLQGADYYVNVIDSIRTGLFSGVNMVNDGVNKTWEVGSTSPSGSDAAELILQHLNKDEGSLFALNKPNAFISRFNGNSWDTIGVPLPSQSGYLTTGAPLANSSTNGRLFGSLPPGASYYTKLTTTKGLHYETIVWLNGYRMDAKKVVISWITRPEVNVRYFVVQRRLITETAYKDIDSVLSIAGNGLSFTDLHYLVNDPNEYRGISFYRLKMIPYNNIPPAYSDSVSVSGTPGVFNITLWPNPTLGDFNISLDTKIQAKAIVIWNAIGQKMMTENVNRRAVVQVKGLWLRPGTYFVGVIGIDGAIIQTKKLVVLSE